MSNTPDLGTLVGGGDCLDHYHNSDRFPSRDTLLWLQSLERIVTITANYAVTSDDDIIIVDGSGLIITLPPARNGRHYRFSTISGDATVTPNGTETIDGAASYSLNGSGFHASCHLKAITNGWIKL